MIDVPNWVTALITLIGSVAGGYLGVRVAVTRLQVQVEGHTGDLGKIWKWIGDFERDWSDHKSRVAVLEAASRNERRRD
jgi:hypothetical protein